MRKAKTVTGITALFLLLFLTGSLIAQGESTATVPSTLDWKVRTSPVELSFPSGFTETVSFTLNVEQETCVGVYARAYRGAVFLPDGADCSWPTGGFTDGETRKSTGNAWQGKRVTRGDTVEYLYAPQTLDEQLSWDVVLLFCLDEQEQVIDTRYLMIEWDEEAAAYTAHELIL